MTARHPAPQAPHVHLAWELAAVAAKRGLDPGTLMTAVAAQGEHLSRSQSFALFRARSFATPPRLTATLCAALDCAPGDLMPRIVIADPVGPWADPIPPTSALDVHVKTAEAMAALEPTFGKDRRFDAKAVQRVVHELRDGRRDRS